MDKTLPRPFSEAPPASALDPVCGKVVNPKTSKWFIQHANQTFYLCSLSCALRFKDAPETFTTSPSPPDQH
jgi:YHS domain-containing protein